MEAHPVAVRTFYVMFGHPERRRWEDARRYGFVSAGGGRRWSRPLERLTAGDEVLVHVPQAGYVGHGEVLGGPLPAADTVVHVDGTSVPLLRAPLISSRMGWDDAGDDAEHVVPVRWEKAVPTRQAYWRSGLFYTRTTVWPFGDADQALEIKRSL